jgi:signal transduction histidine kinase
LIGRPVASLVCPISSSVFAEWERSMHGGQSDPIEVALFRRDGGSTWAQLSVVPPLHHGGALQGVCVVATDIADRVQREAELRRSSDELRALSAKLVKVQERECQRIATDLHDGLGQSLTAMKYGLEQTLCQLRAGATGASVPMLEVLLARLKDAVGEVRRVAMNARPSTLDDLGVVATLSWLFREFETIYPDIAVRRHVDIAMNNIAKHSQASVVDVSLRRIDDHLELVILDNGRGFDPEAVALRPAGAFGLGLGSIRDRAIFAGGTHSLRASVGKGVEIRVSLPLAVGVPEQCGEAGPAGGTVANAGVQLQRK